MHLPPPATTATSAPSATTSLTPVQVPDTPDRVWVNGDSRGLSSGRIVVTWDRVADATSYLLWHDPPKACGPRPCPQPYSVALSDDEDSNPDTLTYSVSELAVPIFYTVEVRAVRGSDESEAAVGYAYTTRTPLPLHTRSVAITELQEMGTGPVAGYRAGYRASPGGNLPVYGHYAYTLCTNTLSDHFMMNARQRLQIEAAVRIWRDNVGFVTYSQSTGECHRMPTDEDEDTGYPSWIYLTPVDMMHEACDSEQDDGCVDHYPDPIITPYGRITSTQVFVRANASTVAQTSLDGMCSRLFQIVMHEAGHAYGLDHPTRSGSEALMGVYEVHCEPQAYDAVAIAAIYQSR